MPNVSLIDGHIDEPKKHKCDGCKYKGEHQEMGFKAVAVCLREHNLLKAEIAYNAKKCPFSNPTNYDRIRNMSVEEMAEFICGIYDFWYCNECVKFINGDEIPDYDERRVKGWLESEVTE